MEISLERRQCTNFWVLHRLPPAAEILNAVFKDYSMPLNINKNNACLASVTTNSSRYSMLPYDYDPKLFQICSWYWFIMTQHSDLSPQECVTRDTYAAQFLQIFLLQKIHNLLQLQQSRYFCKSHPQPMKKNLHWICNINWHTMDFISTP